MSDVSTHDYCTVSVKDAALCESYNGDEPQNWNVNLRKKKFSNNFG